MVTTHYLDEAEHCNQLAFIYGGHIIARGSPEELKRAPGAGVTVEIVSNENIALLDALEDEAYVRDSSLYGSTLHVTVERRADLESLRHFLAGRGVQAPELAPITPSLEDIFAGLIEVANRSRRSAVMNISWRRVWTIAVKEYTQFFRDRRTVVSTMLMPLIQVVLYGYLSSDVRHQPTVVWDLSRPPKAASCCRRSRIPNTSRLRLPRRTCTTW